MLWLLMREHMQSEVIRWVEWSKGRDYVHDIEVPLDWTRYKFHIKHSFLYNKLIREILHKNDFWNVFF